MPVAASLADHLSETELRERYLSSPRRSEGIRWHALVLKSQGYSHAEIARITQRGTRWVSEIIRRYNRDGIGGIRDRTQDNGAGLLLSETQQDELHQLLQTQPPDGGIWTGLKVLVWIEQQVGQELNLSTAYDYIHRLNLSQQVPRTHHRKADKDAQETLKSRGLKRR